MSSDSEISLSDSLTPAVSAADMIFSSPIFQLTENSSSENTNDSNLTSDVSSSSPPNLGERSADTLDLTNDTWQASLGSFHHDIIEAEIASIRLFCEEVDNNLTQIGLGPVGSNSTPRNSNAGRNRNRRNTPAGSEPEDVIDLSNLDFYPPRRLQRVPTPEAVIDLCTPETTPRLPAFINLADSTNEARAVNRRRLYDNNATSAPAESQKQGISPPKRECLRKLDKSPEAYKCPVCLECVQMREPSSTKCGHIFCKSCIDAVIASTHKCPLCNKRVAKRSIFRIYL